VNFVKIISDARTKRSRGFGFVYMLDLAGDTAVSNFAAEHNHRITLMGKVRVFLARHDNNREQPRLDGKQSHDGNLAKIHLSSYSPSNSYSNNGNGYHGSHHQSAQTHLPYRSAAAAVAVAQGTYCSGLPSQRPYEQPLQDSYTSISNSTVNTAIYTAPNSGTSTQYLPSSFQQQYPFSPDTTQAASLATTAPYSQPQGYSVAQDYSSQAAIGYPPTQIPPQQSQPVLYPGEPSASYGGHQPVQPNISVDQYSQTNSTPPQQSTTFPLYSSVSSNNYASSERDPSYSQFSKSSVVYDSLQGQHQQSNTPLLSHSLKPPQNQQTSQSARDPASALSTKVLIQNLPRHTPPKDVVQLLSKNNLTVCRCTMEFPTENSSQAFAHVNLGSAGDAATCLLLSQQQKLSIEGRILTASLDQSPPADGVHIPVGRGAPVSTGLPRPSRGRGRGQGAGRFDRKRRLDRPY